jgi:uncharacterized membrane protein YhiD involved in acid resistance
LQLEPKAYTVFQIRLAAAVGALCGGGLMSYALMLVTVIVLMLRFGPRNSELELDMIAEDENGEGGEEEEDEGEAGQQGQVAAETASVAASITSRQSNASMRTASTLQYLGERNQNRATICTDT